MVLLLLRQALLARLAPRAPSSAVHRAQLPCSVYELAVVDLCTFKFTHHSNTLLIYVIEHVDKGITQFVDLLRHEQVAPVQFNLDLCDRSCLLFPHCLLLRD